MEEVGNKYTVYDPRTLWNKPTRLSSKNSESLFYLTNIVCHFKKFRVAGGMAAFAAIPNCRNSVHVLQLSLCVWKLTENVLKTRFIFFMFIFPTPINIFRDALEISCRVACKLVDKIVRCKWTLKYLDSFSWNLSLSNLIKIDLYMV
jgi:hypothetical protein